jgi:dipeptidyl-peptidase-4
MWKTPAMKLLLAGALCVATIASASAQDRLSALPGYDQYERMAPQIANNWTSGAIVPRWDADGRGFTYALRGRTYRFDFSSLTSSEATAAVPPAQPAQGGRGRGTPPPSPVLPMPAGRSGGAEQAQMEMPRAPIAGCPMGMVARGRQSFCELSPDGARKAFYRDRNLWIANADGSNEVRITSDGSDTTRIKYGVASWVYGEELSQTTAMWWSPDSRKLAFYRFDESKVQDFYVTMGQTSVQDTVDVEAYPKAGTANPIADVLVYDVAAARTTPLDVRDGRPFDNFVIGHYVYNIQWRADSSELLLNRANRRHQVVEFSGCAAATGKCRAIVREEWLTGWIDTDAAPSPRWLADRTRFIWPSDRNGWRNYYLYDLTGKLIAPLTSNSFDASGIVKVDEAAGLMFYTAHDGDNFMKSQVHRVGLDGSGERRLTDPVFHHSAAGVSPDNKYIVDVYQRHDAPPASRLLDAATGNVLAEIAAGDVSGLDRLGFRRTEQFTYAAADGTTTLYGQISFPSNFDPARKYPVLVPVYGGPVGFSSVPLESFMPPVSTAEYGFLIVRVQYRGVSGTGKRGADALYLKLGQTEMDDMAAGIKALWSRPYVDKERVGIYGTSYGGYTAAMQLMRHPDVFAAAASSSPVTDWRNYDTIYTERYMWLPQENRQGYDAGNVMTYVNNLRGRLLLYYGTADNNVHPSNALQLIRALQRANKSFDVQVGPDLPHSAVNAQRMMEFFIEHLVLHPERLRARP